MEKQKLILEPGRSYLGHGGVNEFGETFFRPSQKGSRPGNMTLVKECENYSIYESTHKVKICITFDKDLSPMDRVKLFMRSFQLACVEIKRLRI